MIYLGKRKFSCASNSTDMSHLSDQSPLISTKSKLHQNPENVESLMAESGMLLLGKGQCFVKS